MGEGGAPAAGPTAGPVGSPPLGSSLAHSHSQAPQVQPCSGELLGPPPPQPGQLLWLLVLLQISLNDSPSAPEALQLQGPEHPRPLTQDRQEMVSPKGASLKFDKVEFTCVVLQK